VSVYCWKVNVVDGNRWQARVMQYRLKCDIPCDQYLTLYTAGDLYLKLKYYGSNISEIDSIHCILIVNMMNRLLI